MRMMALLAVIFLLSLSAVCGAGMAVYYGNVHCHTEASDGEGTFEEAFEHARDIAQIDVLAITDHSHMLDGSEYNECKTKASFYTDDGVFVAIAGQEHGSLSTTHAGAFGHLNFYEASTIIPQYLGGYRYRYDLPGTYDWINNHSDTITGAPLYGMFNHPYYSGGCEPDAQFRHFEWSEAGDNAMQLIEMMNGRLTRAYEEECRDCLSKGWHVGFAADQDNHHKMWGDQMNSNGDVILTGIVADTLTQAGILEAMRLRRTFAVEISPWTPVRDELWVWYTADGHWMGEAYTNESGVVEFHIEVGATSCPIYSIRLFRNWVQVDQVFPGSTSYIWETSDTPGLGTFYYHVKVVQQDSDRAWASPVWVSTTSAPITSIAEVNADDENGRPLLLGESVTVQGICTVGTDNFDLTSNDLFIQDWSGGVNCFEWGSQTELVLQGDDVTVTGIVDQYKGQTRVSITNTVVNNSGNPGPSPAQVTTTELEANGEAYEGALIRIVNCLKVGGTWPPEGWDALIDIDDGTGPAKLFIDKETDIDGSPEPTEAVDIVGVVRQEDTSAPYLEGYRIVPRALSDIAEGTGVPHAGTGPVVARLDQNFPNPFNPETTIVFRTAGRRCHALLRIFDANGRLVSTLADGDVEPGEHIARWNGRDTAGNAVASGIYLCLLDVEGVQETRKMALLK